MPKRDYISTPNNTLSYSHVYPYSYYHIHSHSYSPLLSYSLLLIFTLIVRFTLTYIHPYYHIHSHSYSHSTCYSAQLSYYLTLTYPYYCTTPCSSLLTIPFHLTLTIVCPRSASLPFAPPSRMTRSTPPYSNSLLFALAPPHSRSQHRRA